MDFRFAEPPPGPVDVRWTTDHGITDTAPGGNAFSGGSWSYTLDPDAPDADLIIREFLAANLTGLRDEDGDRSDWIEVANRGAASVVLAGHSLTDDPEEERKWTFPAVTLGAQEAIVVFASGKDRRDPGGELHLNFKLNSSGEHLALYGPESTRRPIHEFAAYPEQRPDVSYGLNGLGEPVYLAPPTPGASNSASTVIRELLSDPFFTVPRGFYDEPFDLDILESTPDADLYFTLDGSEPTTQGGTL